MSELGKKDDGSFKVFLPVKESGLTFNEILVWSWLVRADRRNRAASKKEIREVTGLNFRTIDETLDALLAKGLVTASGETPPNRTIEKSSRRGSRPNVAKDHRTWRAKRSDLFQPRLLSTKEITEQNRRQVHWSQLLHYFRFAPLGGFTIREAAVYWLARSFAQQGRTFNQATFSTLLDIGERTMNRIAFRLADSIDWRTCKVQHSIRPRQAKLHKGPSPDFMARHAEQLDLASERLGIPTPDVAAHFESVYREHGEGRAVEWIWSQIAG